MLGKMLVFCFCLIGIFALIMAMLPSEFITASFVYNPSYRDVEIEEEFDANDMIIYDQSGTDNMTYPYTSLEDGPIPPDWEAGLPENNFLEIGWGLTFDYEGFQCIKARLRVRNWIGPWYWWSTAEDLTFYAKDTTNLGLYLYKSTLETYWDDDTNASAFSAKANTIQTNFLVKQYNISKTIGQNWDDGTLHYLLTYEANFTASGFGAFTLISKLLLFQAPSLGISGSMGTFLNMLIAIPMWSCIAYIVYKVIAGLIPFVSGGSGD